MQDFLQNYELSYSKRHGGFCMKKLFIGALIGITLISVAVGIANNTSKDAKEEVKIEEVQEKEEEKKEAELTPEKKIEKFSKKICGKENYRSYTYLPSSDSSVCDGYIAIDSDFHDNLTNEYINLGECDNAFELAKAIFTDDTFKGVNELRYCVWAKYVDKFGNEDEHIAMKIFITRDTFSQFNLESENAHLLYQNLPDVADYYSTDFKEN